MAIRAFHIVSSSTEVPDMKRPSAKQGFNNEIKNSEKDFNYRRERSTESVNRKSRSTVYEPPNGAVSYTHLTLPTN